MAKQAFRTQIMGVLNLTPDSFSDGSEISETDKVLSQIEDFITEGAQFIDVGAESTAPGAKPVSPKDEWARLKPVVESIPTLFKHAKVTWSFDTRHADTVKNIVSTLSPEKFSLLINDVSGGEDTEILEIIAKNPQLRYVFMHHLTIPADPAITMPDSQDIIQEIFNWAIRKLATFRRIGIERDQLIFDPGLGFGKTQKQNWDILQNIHILQRLGFPLLIGHSRKSMFNEVAEIPAAKRDSVTAITSVLLMQKKVDILRVHNVELTAHCRRILELIYE